MNAPLYEGANTLPWSDDLTAQSLVSELGAMTQVQVATVLGVSKKRVEQIEARGLHKLRLALTEVGYEFDPRLIGKQTKAITQYLEAIRRAV